MAGRRSSNAVRSRSTSPVPPQGAAAQSTSSSRAPSHQHSKASSSQEKNKNTFNPRLIFSQIIALQCFHYLILGFIIQCNSVLFSTSITIDRIFTDRFLNVWSLSGWVDNSAILLSYIVGAVLLATIVEKSKKCLDFSATLFLINLLCCCLYGGIPSTWDWWIIHVLGTIVMILLGEYLCSRRELSDIPLLDF